MMPNSCSQFNKEMLLYSEWRSRMSARSVNSRPSGCN